MSVSRRGWQLDKNQTMDPDPKHTFTLTRTSGMPRTLNSKPPATEKTGI